MLVDDEIIKLRQSRLDRRRNFLGKLCRPDAVAFADEQRIFQHVAEPIERIRQRRLRDAKTAGSAGDAPLLHESQEDGQKVQIVFHSDVMAREYLKSNK
ncbi:hypothetical protein D3C71_1017640 [compost metagenome]